MNLLEEKLSLYEQVLQAVSDDTHETKELLERELEEALPKLEKLALSSLPPTMIERVIQIMENIAETKSFKKGIPDKTAIRREINLIDVGEEERSQQDAHVQLQKHQLHAPEEQKNERVIHLMNYKGKDLLIELYQIDKEYLVVAVNYTDQAITNLRVHFEQRHDANRNSLPCEPLILTNDRLSGLQAAVHRVCNVQWEILAIHLHYIDSKGAEQDQLILIHS